MGGGSPKQSVLRSKTDRHGDGRKASRKSTYAKFVIGVLAFVCLTIAWTSFLPRHALPGGRRGDFRPEVSTKAVGKGAGAHKTHRRSHNSPGTNGKIGATVFGGALKHESKRSDTLDKGQTNSNARRLILASHGLLMWLDIDTRSTEVIHEGRGVYYGTFPAKDDGTQIWVVSRPHNWRPSDVRESLLKIDLASKQVTDEVQLPTHFTHDAVRHGDLVFVADTGGDGASKSGGVVELSFPELRKTKSPGVQITTKEHVNTLAPVGDPNNPHLVWALLHNLGPSKLVLLDLSTGQRIRELHDVGNKAHGLVPWRDGFLILNSGEGALCIFTPPEDADDASQRGTLETLWQDDKKTFMKGLAVIENVAYFGLAEFGGRQSRDDASKTAEVGAFDLVSRKFLWRTTVETKGLLNIVAAPHISQHSTYFPVSSWDSNSGDFNSENSGDEDSEQDFNVKDSTNKPHLGESFALGDDGHDLRGSAPELTAPSGVPWIDLRQKKHLTSNKDPDLLIQHVAVDVAALRAELENTPGFCAKQSQDDNARLGGRKGNMDQFKPGVDSAILIFSDYNGRLVFKFPWFDKYEALLEPILTKLLKNHFGLEHPMRHVIRLQFACMNPHSQILKHTDRGGWVKNGHRIHIPLIVPDTAGAGDGDLSFVMIVDGRGDVDVPLVEGNVFEINNNVPHRVHNDAETWRVHLLLDFTEDETPETARFALHQGQTCEYHGLDECTRNADKWPWSD